MLFDEDHKAVSQAAAAELSEDKSFGQSIDGFPPYYQHFGAHPEYAQAILREARFHNPLRSPPASARETGPRSIGRITRTIEIVRKRRAISIDESDDALARLVFEIYQIESRHWFGSRQPDVEAGLVEHRRALSSLARIRRVSMRGGNLVLREFALALKRFVPREPLRRTLMCFRDSMVSSQDRAPGLGKIPSER
jgi:hypothetical protein